jgi:hypothetical protein
VDDQELEREIQAVREILQVRLRRYNREMRELERDLKGLRALQRARRGARGPLPISEGPPPVAEEGSP